MSQNYERKSDVDGFTIIERPGRTPMVHLLRSWDECNVELARKRGSAVSGVVGSRETLMAILPGRRVRWCRRCFPAPKIEEAPVLVEEYAPGEEPQ